MLEINAKYKNIVKRYNNVMEEVGCEYLALNGRLSEIEREKEYYGVEENVKLSYMLYEAEYWLSCYYEEGNCRCDDRFESPEDYAIWRSESGKLKRLKEALEKLMQKENERGNEDAVVGIWK